MPNTVILNEPGMKVFFFRADIRNGNRVVKTKLDTFYKMSFAVRDSNLSNIYATKRFGVLYCNCNLFTHEALRSSYGLV